MIARHRRVCAPRSCPPSSTPQRAAGRWRLFAAVNSPRPHGKQLIDPLLDLRRRRYGTSHGV